MGLGSGAEGAQVAEDGGFVAEVGPCGEAEECGCRGAADAAAAMTEEEAIKGLDAAGEVDDRLGVGG